MSEAEVRVSSVRDGVAAARGLSFSEVLRNGDGDGEEEQVDEQRESAEDVNREEHLVLI